MSELKPCGTLYGIGVGPGDPELLTLRAVHRLNQTQIIAVPVTREDRESLALEISRPHLPPLVEVMRLEFPMSRDLQLRERSRRQAATAIEQRLRAGENIAFLTEGDSLFYSTFIYILQYLSPDIPVEIIPGVSSINAAAAQAHLPLVNADQCMAVIPASSENLEQLPSLLPLFDTIVLMKLDRTLDKALAILEQAGLADSCTLVERASCPGGRVLRGKEILQNEQVRYFSLLIIRGGKKA